MNNSEVVETEREQQNIAVAPRREPPRALFKVVNPVMKALLSSPLHPLVSGSLVLLTFKGVKSAKIYSIPVGYHRIGEHLYVFTHSPWYHNFRGGANVWLRLQGRPQRAHAELIEDADVVFANIEQLLERIGVRNARRLGIMLGGNHAPSREELRDASRGTVMVRLSLLS